MTDLALSTHIHCTCCKNYSNIMHQHLISLSRVLSLYTSCHDALIPVTTSMEAKVTWMQLPDPQVSIAGWQRSCTSRTEGQYGSFQQKAHQVEGNHHPRACPLSHLAGVQQRPVVLGPLVTRHPVMKVLVSLSTNSNYGECMELQGQQSAKQQSTTRLQHQLIRDHVKNPAQCASSKDKWTDLLEK